MERENKNFAACFVGPPGSGKTSAAKALYDMYKKLGRNTLFLNLDPGNDEIKFNIDFDICDYITITDIMKEQNLGPNGALMFCFSEIKNSEDTIVSEITKMLKEFTFIVIDSPGQVELYTHSQDFRDFLKSLSVRLNFNYCTVNLVDIALLRTSESLLGQTLMSLATMIRMDCPAINVISKYDLIFQSDLDFDPDNFDFDSILISRGVPKPLHTAVVNLINMYDLVSFEKLSINDETTIIEVLEVIDKCLGTEWHL